MKVRIKVFAGLRDQLDLEETEVTIAGGVSVADIWRQLFPDQALTADRIMIAVNHEYCDGDQALHEGDEVAFFPPVTGG